MSELQRPDPLLVALRNGVPHSPLDWKIKHLWGEGFNTFDIALNVDLPEHEVSRRLSYLRGNS